MKDKKKIIKGIIITLVVIGFIWGMIYIIAKGTAIENVITLAPSELQEKLDNEEDFVLVFTSTTCDACKEYKPILNRILKENDVVGYEVVLQDYTTSDEIGIIYDLAEITGTPTTIFVDGGIEKDENNRIVATFDEDVIREKLEENGYIK